MTVTLDPTFEAPKPVVIGDWHPCRFTPSLTGNENFPSAGDRLIAAAPLYFRAAGVAKFELDPWQTWLIRHVLEVYPDDWPVERLRGQLRFRQVVISMGRQNGKSLIAALFVMWALTMHVGGPSVVGFASSEKQAKIVYKRVGYAIRHSPELRRLLKYTLTQGITRKDGAGEYDTIAADEDAAQGIPITAAIGDELHLLAKELWAAIVNGQRAQSSSILIGITTAGDDDSKLLISLYKQIDEAIGGKHERFGGFIWEAPEGSTVEDDAAIIAANPSIACGRIDLEQAKSDARLQPEPDQQRYLFNRFISSTNSWLPMRHWRERGLRRVQPTDKDVAFTIDRTPDQQHATIAATARVNGQIVTSLVASITRPTDDRITAIAERLAQKAPGAVFAMDSFGLKRVGARLKSRGFTVQMLTLADVTTACSTAYSQIVAGNVLHGHDQLLDEQHGQARRKNIGESWRISRTESGGDIDAVMATVFGIYVIETTEMVGSQVF